MQHKEYIQIKDQIEKAYNDAMAEATSERDENIAALERVWKLANSTNGIAHQSAEEEKEEENETEEKGFGFVVNKEKLDSVTDAIRSIFGDLPDRFSSRDVIARLHQKYPGKEIKKTTIASTLKRFEESNEINLHEQGSGRRPSVFSKVKKEDSEKLYEEKQNGE